MKPITSTLCLGLLIFVLQPVQAQNGHTSEFAHIADSLVKVAERVPASEHAVYFEGLREYADALRAQHLRFTALLLGEAEASIASEGGPIKLMNDKTYTSASRAGKVAEDHYFATLVVLDSLWESEEALRRVDKSLVEHRIGQMQRMLDLWNGIWPPFAEVRHDYEEDMTVEEYNAQMERTVAALELMDGTPLMERLRIEMAVLTPLLN